MANRTYFTDEEWNETPADRSRRLGLGYMGLPAIKPPAGQAPAKPPAKKGHCSKCGKHIGRGLHFHEKACKG